MHLILYDTSVCTKMPHGTTSLCSVIRFPQHGKPRIAGIGSRSVGPAARCRSRRARGAVGGTGLPPDPFPSIPPTRSAGLEKLGCIQGHSHSRSAAESQAPSHGEGLLEPL